MLVVIVAVVVRSEMVVVVLIVGKILIKMLIFYLYFVHIRSRYCFLLLGRMVLQTLDINLLEVVRSFGLS